MKDIKLLLLYTVCLSVFAAVTYAAAAPPTAPSTQPDWNHVEVDHLTLHPSAVTQPALQYRLLPDWTDLKEGNAVTLYLVARRYWPDQKTTDEVLSPEKGRYDYLDTPTEQFPRQYADRLLSTYAQTLQYVDLGARRRDAVWDFGWNEPWPNGQAPTMYLNDLRHEMNLLGFRVRVQIENGDWSGAQYTMQTMFSTAGKTMTKPLLFHALCAAGFGQIGLSRGVESWISHGASPNLYWPLTDLPQPFVDQQSVLQQEKVEMRVESPEIYEAVYGNLPARQWPHALEEMVGMLQENRRPFKRDPAKIEAETKRLIALIGPRARQYLASSGMTKDKIDAMPVEQAVGTYWAHEYRSAYDELAKSWNLSYVQAEQRMSQAWRALAPDKSPALDNPLIQANLVSVSNAEVDYSSPNLLRFRYWMSRTDRQSALLRTVEALRDYAARHDGRPPERLDQITDLPLPIDPYFDKPFGYERDGQKVILDAPSTSGHPPISGWRLELTFANGS